MTTLNLTPSTGTPGSFVTASGKGYRPAQSLRLFVGRSIVMEVQCDEHGNFSKDFAVPPGWIGDNIVRVAVATSTAAKFTVSATPPPPEPEPSGDWLKRIDTQPARITGPTTMPDMPSTYCGTRLTVQQMMEHGWNAGFRSAEDLQILAAISLAESGGDIGCRNWHNTFGFKVPGEPEHLLMAVPAGARYNGLLMRSDRGAWQISDHFYPGAFDAECDDPATAAKIVKWIKDNRGGWSQWDTYNDGSFRNKVQLSVAQAFVASKQ